MKKKFKLKTGNNKFFEKLKAPFVNRNNQIILASLLVLFSFFLVIAFTSFFINWQADNSIVLDNNFTNIITNNEIKNSLGGLGAYLSHTLIFRLFGISAYLIFAFTLLLGLKIFGLKRISISNILFHVLLALIYVPVFIFHFYENALLSGGLGIQTQSLCKNALGDIGTTLLLLTALLIYLPLTLNIKFKEVTNFINLISSKLKSIKPEKKDDKPVEVNEIKIEDSIENIPKSEVTLAEKEDDPIADNSAKEIQIDEQEKENDIAIEINATDNEEKLSEEEIKRKLKELGDYDPTLELSSYKMPGIDLLNDYGGSEIKIDKDDLEDKKNKIVETLGHYKIGISSISATVGPTITLYEIVPEAGVRISKIKNLEDDIALSLSAEGIRIIAPIPGKGTIGIEVPNKTKNTVSMLEVLSSEKFQNNDMALPIAFGKTISNETYLVDLAKMPHLLMAGATGQGKSVGLNAVLASLLYKKHPSQVKFVLIDPKKVELTLYNKIERHYLAKLPDQDDAIITDTKKVVNTVNSLCIEMDERYELCKSANCRNIIEYNKKFISRKLNPNKGHRYLPYIVLVIDEFADLIMTAGKEIETPIARLAQLARAIGIHLIIATQRPSVDVITGLIKANIPTRIAFQVSTKIDSRTILDQGGAEQLLGYGDMLYLPPGVGVPVRVHGAFVGDDEVHRVVNDWKSRAEPNYIDEITSSTQDTGPIPGWSGSETSSSEETDELYDEAVNFVIESRRASISAVQRKLRIGYNRAARLIETMEEAGLVSEMSSNGSREVLVPKRD